MSDKAIVRHEGEGRKMLVGGTDCVTYKVTPDETDRTYFLFEINVAPGAGAPLHEHDYREVFYLLEGECKFLLQQGGETQKIVGKPGTVVAVEPGVPHAFRASGDTAIRMLSLQLTHFLDDFFEEIGVPVESVPEGLIPSLDSVVAEEAMERHGVHMVARAG